MAGIKVDPDWVADYATKAAAAADDLDKGADLLGAAPLGNEAFGSLGRTVRTADAYLRAAALLRGQLARSVEALNAASDGLAKVAEQYRTSDDGSAHTIRRSAGD